MREGESNIKVISGFSQLEGTTKPFPSTFIVNVLFSRGTREHPS